MSLDPKPSPSASSWKIDTKSCLRIVLRRKWKLSEENHVLSQSLALKSSPSASPWKIDTKGGLKIVRRRTYILFIKSRVFEGVGHWNHHHQLRLERSIPPVVLESFFSEKWSQANYFLIGVRFDINSMLIIIIRLRFDENSTSLEHWFVAARIHFDNTSTLICYFSTFIRHDVVARRFNLTWMWQCLVATRHCFETISTRDFAFRNYFDANLALSCRDLMFI